MWQFNFHSPHMNYFNEQNMKLLLSKHDLDCINVFKLDSLDFSSVKERILADKGMNKLKGACNGLALTADEAGDHAIRKPDIKAFFFKKK